MAARDDPVHHAARRAARQFANALDDIRHARIGAGLSQQAVASRVGISRARLGRIENGQDRHVHIDLLAMIAGAVGLELAVRTFAGGGRVRDRAQLRALDRFRVRLGPEWTWLSEVPLPLPGDQRAWDLVGTHMGSGLMIWVEAESRVHDSQALLRRLALKRKDSDAARLILVVSDTHGNRDALREARDAFAEAFPGSMRRAIPDLVAGRDPGDDVLLVL
jgi:transcriptional regulator with XRE-family HTH domain